ncbi:hypothetical protein LCGC14_0908850 [marine sediment metagenome]|uniref:Putative regulatory protein FmdB zinc ribbon domain-containing protein n=1 Tax=marine sediment metagenome TaxID=412755 RepID=A0A0F9PEY4_9ZZZZ
MAIYEFGCGVCKATIEKIQSFHAPLPTCCGKEMARLISMPSVPRFNGPGTYATDYGSGAHRLKPYDQRIRAGNEIHKRDLCVARPCPTGPRTAEKIRKLSERR